MIKKFLQLAFILGAVMLFGGRIATAKGGFWGLPQAQAVQRSSAACDAGLALNSADPLDAARALDLCDMAVGPAGEGLISAAWVMADGANAVGDSDYAVGHGILPAFGGNVAVRNGERMLALSTGTARRPVDPGYISPVSSFDKGYTGAHPAGFPQTAASCLGACPLTGTPHDDAALLVTLRAPWYARGFSFDFKYYTTNYPNFLCSSFDDWFVAILSPFPDGSLDGNIALDAGGNPIRSNDATLQVCATNPGAACYSCALGNAELQGTGFENNAASPWLIAGAAVKGGAEITLRFAIYDSGDGIFDSTVLLDNFRWSGSPELYLPLIVR